MERREGKREQDRWKEGRGENDGVTIQCIGVEIWQSDGWWETNNPEVSAKAWDGHGLGPRDQQARREG